MQGGERCLPSLPSPNLRLFPFICQGSWASQCLQLVLVSSQLCQDWGTSTALELGWRMSSPTASSQPARVWGSISHHQTFKNNFPQLFCSLGSGEGGGPSADPRIPMPRDSQGLQPQFWSDFLLCILPRVRTVLSSAVSRSSGDSISGS